MSEPVKSEVSRDHVQAPIWAYNTKFKNIRPRRLCSKAIRILVTGLPTIYMLRAWNQRPGPLYSTWTKLLARQHVPSQNIILYFQNLVLNIPSIPLGVYD
ncbi:hypothetical protein VNI00_006343 [Paramarasmius palmivorus]|uniref:Uncharacterized protein n=1 Tax=Paramarasmius palmivorus TaxID=297713 RepID=A0AAW0D8S9_9AGAR